MVNNFKLKLNIHFSRTSQFAFHALKDIHQRYICIKFQIGINKQFIWKRKEALNYIKPIFKREKSWKDKRADKLETRM